VGQRARSRLVNGQSCYTALGLRVRSDNNVFVALSLTEGGVLAPRVLTFYVLVWQDVRLTATYGDASAVSSLISIGSRCLSPNHFKQQFELPSREMIPPQLWKEQSFPCRNRNAACSQVSIPTSKRKAVTYATRRIVGSWRFPDQLPFGNAVMASDFPNSLKLVFACGKEGK
jgi:hypothetical protein